MDPRPIVLEGRRARLEPLTPEHAPGLHEAAQDDDTWRYLPRARPRTPEDTSAMIEEALRAAQTGRQVPFVIIDRSSGRVAGSTRYLDIQRENRSLEVGWTWLGAPWRRTPINTECKLLLLRHAFDDLGALRVQLVTDARNDRSQRAILRLGASFEGRLRRCRILPDGFVRDTMVFGIVALEWPDVRCRLEALLGSA